MPKSHDNINPKGDPEEYGGHASTPQTTADRDKRDMDHDDNDNATAAGETGDDGTQTETEAEATPRRTTHKGADLGYHRGRDRPHGSQAHEPDNQQGRQREQWSATP